LQSFDEILDKSNRGRAVRWPFRVLAALLVLAAVFALAGSAYTAFRRGDLRAALYTVTFLPIVALVVRLGGYAVWKGSVLRNPYWPFASGALASLWVLMGLIIVSYV
jgi:hypothetical protein